VIENSSGHVSVPSQLYLLTQDGQVNPSSMVIVFDFLSELPAVISTQAGVGGRVGELVGDGVSAGVGDEVGKLTGDGFGA
jgi:hypothetical protein